MAERFISKYTSVTVACRCCLLDLKFELWFYDKLKCDLKAQFNAKTRLDLLFSNQCYFTVENIENLRSLIMLAVFVENTGL